MRMALVDLRVPGPAACEGEETGHKTVALSCHHIGII